MYVNINFKLPLNITKITLTIDELSASDCRGAGGLIVLVSLAWQSKI